MNQATPMHYLIGFTLSLILTGVAYILVSEQLLSGGELITMIVLLAATQVLVQLIFFLHLGNEPRPRWKLVVFLFMLVVLGILVGGSLWIMQNLDYNMMPSDMDSYIIHDEGMSP